MLFRSFILLTGFGMAVAGGVSTIAYLNLLTTGYSYMDYFIYISKKVECYLLPLGILLVWISVYNPLRIIKK
jgi:hypothetical protein